MIKRAFAQVKETAGSAPFLYPIIYLTPIHSGLQARLLKRTTFSVPSLQFFPHVRTTATPREPEWFTPVKGAGLSGLRKKVSTLADGIMAETLPAGMDF